ncbi:MAG: hypothetical protein H7338_03150, partial [Candidatus Sericytochromatia bacterium]|nr:hypothetical protein [Candidatus Sericytochromatia bacterium]
MFNEKTSHSSSFVPKLLAAMLALSVPVACTPSAMPNTPQGQTQTSQTPTGATPTTTARANT